MQRQEKKKKRKRKETMDKIRWREARAKKTKDTKRIGDGENSMSGWRKKGGGRAGGRWSVSKERKMSL